MFIFVGGVSPKVSSKWIDLECPVCSRPTTVEKQVNQVFSVFFVPLLTLHRGQTYRVCPACGWDSRKGEGRELLERSDSQALGPPDRAGSRPSQHGGWQGDSHSAPSAPELPTSCNQCGSPVQHSYLFCPFCGTFLKE